MNYKSFGCLAFAKFSDHLLHWYIHKYYKTLLVAPPSTTRFCPVIKEALSIVRKATAPAISSSFAIRPKGVLETILFSLSGSDNTLPVEGVRVNQGRSEERRVGKEGVSTCSSGWSPNH